MALVIQILLFLPGPNDKGLTFTVIIGINTWAELMALVGTCNSATGVLLPFKESSSELPLIPSLDHGNGVVKQCAAKPDFIPRQLECLNRFCGFRDILKSYVNKALFSQVICWPFWLSVTRSDVVLHSHSNPTARQRLVPGLWGTTRGASSI